MECQHEVEVDRGYIQLTVQVQHLTHTPKKTYFLIMLSSSPGVETGNTRDAKTRPGTARDLGPLLTPINQFKMDTGANFLVPQYLPN